jgi:hypothetical protein
MVDGKQNWKINSNTNCNRMLRYNITTQSIEYEVPINLLKWNIYDTIDSNGERIVQTQMPLTARN